MNKRPSRLSGIVVLLSLLFLGTSYVHAQTQLPVTDPAGDGHFETIEYFVPHVSTVPATAGEEVMLFLRERVRVHGRRERPAVLMVTGATTSAIPVFDLEFQEYSWMTHLARAGFDVFVM